MTVVEFEATKGSLECVACHRRGLVQFAVLAGHIGIACPHCGKQHALGRILWLAQHDKPKTRRKDYAMGQSIVEVWDRFKNRCAICTLPQAALAQIGIGPTNHHVTEKYDPSEYDCPIIPVCRACKEFVDARQREAWRWHRRLQELQVEPIPPSGAGISAPRVSPDPVRAEREAPVGALEGFPDDDADE